MARSPILPSDCESVMRALWDYLDRELDNARMLAVEAHLAECEQCLAHAAFERHLIDEIGRVRVRHDEPDVLQRSVLATLSRARSATRSDRRSLLD